MIQLKKYSYHLGSACGILLLPLATHAKSLQEMVDNQIVPLGNLIIKVLYAVAFLLFLVGMVRFFFSDNEETRQKGKQFAIWSIVGLVALFAVWGIVHVLLNVLTSFNT
ncbi:MAG: hypothetical protein JWL75_339 [Parcubacteria group bacterium]|nr:hypothetical protein [Parcubacteria group bacterium]